MIWSDGLQTGDLCIDSCHSTMLGCLDKMYEAVIEKEMEAVWKLVRSFRDLCSIHGDIEHSLFGGDHSPSHCFLDDILVKLHPQDYSGRHLPILLEIVHNLQRAILNDVFHDKAALKASGLLPGAGYAVPPRPVRWSWPVSALAPHGSSTLAPHGSSTPAPQKTSTLAPQAMFRSRC